MYVLPAPSGIWRALATVSVDFREERLSLEIEYDVGAFRLRPDPAILLEACRIDIRDIWGGPEHFIRFALLELQAYASPTKRRN